MININNYPKAYTEIDELIKYLPKNEYEKIDKNFIEMIKKRKDKEYVFKVDKTKIIEEQSILKETRTILAYIYLNYLGTKEENEIIYRKFRKDIEKAEQVKKEQYSTDIFKIKFQENVPAKELIVYNENENFITKIINKIIGFIKNRR